MDSFWRFDKSTYWNQNLPFPKFQFKFLEEKKPPTWFVEVLISAFIDDYDKVADFEEIMRRWEHFEIVKYRNKAFALFSQNEVALPYLSMAFNYICKKTDFELNNKCFGIDVYEPYLEDFKTQKKNNEALTVKEFVKMKVDLSAMLKRTYGLVLFALSKFRNIKGEDCFAFTEDHVKEFLKTVFENNKSEPERTKHAFDSFFKAMESYENPDPKVPERPKEAESPMEISSPKVIPKPEDPKDTLSSECTKEQKPEDPKDTRNSECTKEQKFLDVAFNIIRDLSGFPENLIKFKVFVHDVQKFIKFAKKYDDLLKLK